MIQFEDHIFQGGWFQPPTRNEYEGIVETYDAILKALFVYVRDLISWVFDIWYKHIQANPFSNARLGALWEVP